MWWWMIPNSTFWCRSKCPWSSFKFTCATKAKKICAKYLKSLQSILEGIWVLLRLVGVMCFYLVYQHAREGTVLTWFLSTTTTQSKTQCSLAFGHTMTNFFQTWHDDRDHWTVHLDTSLDDFDLQSHHCIRNLEHFFLFFVFFCACFSIDLD